MIHGRSKETSSFFYEDENSALHLASQYEDINSAATMVELLLKSGVDISIQHSFGDTALYVAAGREFENLDENPIVRKMVDHIDNLTTFGGDETKRQAFINLLNGDGVSMLMLQLIHEPHNCDERSFSRKFLEWGADVNYIIQGTSFSALGILTELSPAPLGCVDLLFEKGVDLTQVLVDGVTSLHLTFANPTHGLILVEKFLQHLDSMHLEAEE